MLQMCKSYFLSNRYNQFSEKIAKEVGVHLIETAVIFPDSNLIESLYTWQQQVRQT